VTIPYARSFPEAELFISLQPCEVCGEAALEVQGFALGDDFRAVHTTCGNCTNQRDYDFRFPVEPASGWFGGDQPSELVDPGQWLMLADLALEELPPDATQAVDEDRSQAEFACAATEEAMKFLRPDEDRVSPYAFWTQSGYEMYQSAEWRFERDWLESHLRTCREAVARLAG